MLDKDILKAINERLHDIQDTVQGNNDDGNSLFAEAVLKARLLRIKQKISQALLLLKTLSN